MEGERTTIDLKLRQIGIGLFLGCVIGMVLMYPLVPMTLPYRDLMGRYNEALGELRVQKVTTLTTTSTTICFITEVSTATRYIPVFTDDSTLLRFEGVLVHKSGWDPRIWELRKPFVGESREPAPLGELIAYLQLPRELVPHLYFEDIPTQPVTVLGRWTAQYPLLLIVEAIW